MAADENKKRWLKLVSPGRIEKFMRLGSHSDWRSLFFTISFMLLT